MGGIQPPWVYSILALHTLGFPARPPGHRARAGWVRGGVCSWTSTAGSACASRRACRPCGTPRWRRSRSRTRERRRGPGAGDGCRLAAREGGDPVRRLAPDPAAGPAGGWSFEFENENYPDTDDTAEVLIALRRSGIRRRTRRSAAASTGCSRCRARAEDGGPSTFNDRRVMTQIPLCDFDEVIDPPPRTSRRTSSRRSCSAACPRGTRPCAGASATCGAPSGTTGRVWGGGANHVHGTGAVLPRWRRPGGHVRPAGPPGRSATADHQNTDGG